MQVKEQTLREREQADLRLQEALQAEQNALAHLHSLRKDYRYPTLLHATAASQTHRHCHAGFLALSCAALWLLQRLQRLRRVIVPPALSTDGGL